jgi:hypothetical protein
MHYFTHTICLWELNEFEAEAAFSADADTGIITLESVKIGALELTPEQLELAVGSGDVERAVEAVQDWWSDEGWAEAERDEADARGDYEYECWRDHEGVAA